MQYYLENEDSLGEYFEEVLKELSKEIFGDRVVVSEFDLNADKDIKKK